MKKPSAVLLVCLLSFIILLVQGCSVAPGFEVTRPVMAASQASPTSAPAMEEAEETPPAPMATAVSAAGNPDPPAPQPFVLSGARYEHPEKVFSFYPPDDWELVEETSGSAWFEGPGKTEAMRVMGTNTGYKLEGEAFTRFVQARDRNHFGGYQNLAEVNAEIDPEQGVAETVKSFLLENVPYRAVSYYLQYDHVVFICDYWAEEPLFEARSRTVSQFYRSIHVDDAALAEQEPYHLTFDFKSGEGQFTLEVPVSWAFETIEGDFLKAFTFLSPDEHVLVQMVAYDDGDPLTRVDAGKLALEILRLYYADDVKVSQAQVIQPQGYERLTWYSARGGYSGVSQFELRDSAFLLLTVKYDNAFIGYYTDVVDRIVDSYTSP